MEIIIILITLSALYNFAIDYLSNKLITHNELSVGIVTLIHHFTASILAFFPLILFININKGVLLFLLFGVILAQLMWVINKDYCFITQFQNTLINKEYKNYKWISSLPEFIMKYIRDEDWAYSDIRNINKIKEIVIGNGILILYCLKMIIINVKVN